jgi:hypothetical protein
MSAHCGLAVEGTFRTHCERQVIEMLMIQIGKDFCDEVSSEEWTRRLRKLAVKTKV